MFPNGIISPWTLVDISIDVFLHKKGMILKRENIKKYCNLSF